MNVDDSIANKLEAFVKEYYRKFDSREPLKAFEGDFLITSSSVRITTKEEYASFYEEVVASFVDSSHVVSNFIVTHESDNLINAACNVIFTAKQRSTHSPVEMSGLLQFSFVPSHDNASWKISRYLIGA
ncbi:nuclear transport factor 2 family protein [Vibrio crassostreae]|uniref:nuclear transport factor 2 family protein n=1 Tax=Vibrio crassostreae TaxID=246167 RepID=UPI001B30E789